ncbi:hypothetical protein GGR58DRAFT_361393 [Xylaria digitata]|nr:hypothetical protein GGR58DRAFT_361393 [Xylaria digitata]
MRAIEQNLSFMSSRSSDVSIFLIIVTYSSTIFGIPFKTPSKHQPTKAAGHSSHLRSPALPSSCHSVCSLRLSTCRRWTLLFFFFKNIEKAAYFAFGWRSLPLKIHRQYMTCEPILAPVRVKQPPPRIRYVHSTLKDKQTGEHRPINYLI